MNAVVICTPDREPVVKDFYRIIDNAREGQLPTFIRALEYGLAHQPSEPITVLEDDVEIPEDFEGYVNHHSQFIERTDSIVQWFWSGHIWSPTTVIAGAIDRASYFVHRPASMFLYTQCTTYSRNAARFLVAWLKSAVAAVKPDASGRRNMGDLAAAYGLYAAGKDFLIHFPPIANHVGAVSTITEGATLTGSRENPHYNRWTAERITTLRPFPVVIYPGKYDTGKPGITKTKET